MLSAAGAKMLLIREKEKSVQDEINKIDDMIKCAISEGKESVMYHDKLSYNAFIVLRNLGYNVSEVKKNELYSINWRLIGM